MKLPKTLLLTPKADSTNKGKNTSWSKAYTTKDIKLILTSEMHNWSSRHSANMILNFMEILLSYI